MFGRGKRLIAHHSGNKKLHLTETLNLVVTDTILRSVDYKRRGSLILLLDLSKAFDSIENGLLLSSLGVSVAARNWFKRYFKGRSQAVGLGLHHSTWVEYHTMHHYALVDHYCSVNLVAQYYSISTEIIF